MTMPDVTVMGAGAFGLSIAWECARRGAKVRVVEKRRLGAGSSGGLVGALAPHVPENWNEKKAFQLESLLMAESWWAGVAAEGGVDPGYARLGRVQPLADAEAVARAKARGHGAATLWQGRADWRVLPAGDAPGMPVASPSGHVVHDTLTARLSPRLAGRALVAAIRARGGELLEGGGTAAGLTVWATGHEGLAELSAALGRPMGGGVKGQAMLLAHDARDMPQVFGDGVHIVPHGDGTTAIGSTSEREFSAPDTVDAQLDAVHARAVALCPALADAPVLERWAGVRPRAHTRAPLLGPWPGRPEHYVANGGFKIGFGIAPKVAAVMADLLLDGRDGIPDAFRLG